MKTDAGAEQALATLRDYIERSTHWQEGGADRNAAKQALDKMQDAAELAEKGIVEWREKCLRFKALHHDCATQLRLAFKDRDDARAAWGQDFLPNLPSRT